MDDDRIWSFEESLWTADAAHYEESVDDECLMVLPTPPRICSPMAIWPAACAICGTYTA